MGNLTPTFKKYVGIIAEEINQNDNVDVKRDQKSNLDQFKLKDSFVKECYNLLNYLKELRKVLNTVEPDYTNEDDLNMSEIDKDEFDTEFRLQFQQYIQKFKNLEKYEMERQQLIESRVLGSNHNLLEKFRGFNSNTRTIIEDFHKANSKFRTGILQSLNLAISSVSSQFTTMQQDRLTIQKKFELFDLNAGIQSDISLNKTSEQSTTPVHDSLNEVDEPLSIHVSHGPVESVQDEVKHYEETISKLTQEQLQVLETEHEELLNQKNEQLKNVEKINKTILDIVTIQSELSTHLQTQSQNINTMLDNQDEIEVNIQKGNAQLKKAKNSASRTAKLTKYIAIIIGILLLFINYIS